MENRTVQKLFNELFASWLPMTSIQPSSSSASNIGNRAENQDLCYRNDHSAVYLVVDGMGGYEGGALASQIVVETIPVEFEKAISDGSLDLKQANRLLQRAIEKAHREIEFVAGKCPDYQKMGCTMALAIALGDRLLYTHIGDARVYRFRDGKVEQLTKDESMVQELIDAGVIATGKAPTHKWRHVVTNCLTAKGTRKQPHWHELRLSAGDEILLTSDGLTDVVPNTVIEQTIKDNAAPEKTVAGLIREALQRNANDNVSCVLAKFQPVEVTRDQGQ